MEAVKFNVVTLFPGLIEAGLREGVVGQAVKGGIVSVRTLSPRTHTTDVHHSVDDRPFGGGDGMVMMIEPLRQTLEELNSEERGKVVLLSPQGRLWSDEMARSWATEKRPVTLICGRYAGVDQRLINTLVDEEISIGDYVLSGGELAALVVIDSMARQIPGVLGNVNSAHNESFSDGLLECPQFTRPRDHEFGNVPTPLVSGDHEQIRRFRRAAAVVRTRILRPDLWARLAMESELREAVAFLMDLSDDDLRAVGLEKSSLVRLSETRR